MKCRNCNQTTPEPNVIVFSGVEYEVLSIEQVMDETPRAVRDENGVYWAAPEPTGEMKLHIKPNAR